VPNQEHNAQKTRLNITNSGHYKTTNQTTQKTSEAQEKTNNKLKALISGSCNRIFTID